MNICNKKANKTAPEKEDVTCNLDSPEHSRVNGWSWPPHPFQIIAWLVYIFFAVVTFGILIPLVPHHWLPAGYVCTGVMFFCHVCVHLTAVTVDPADPNVRAKKYQKSMAIFDRSRHAHVIENLHCYICDVSVLFLYSLVSAILGIILVVVIALYVFVQYFVDPSQMRSSVHFEVPNSTDVWYVFLPVAPIETTAPVILTLAAVIVVLGFISIGLLGYLLCFHIYLMWNRLSTYDYILHQRHRQSCKKPDEQETNESAPPKMEPIEDVVNSGYTNPEIQVEGSSTTAASGKEVPNYCRNGALKASHGGSKPEQDPEPSVSPQQQTRPKRAAQRKKKRKVQKAPAEASLGGSTDNTKQLSAIFPVRPEPSSAAPQNLMLPIPAFQQRASLPPLAPRGASPVQAAGPPAEYHSDSAESMDEIPVAQTRLGSAAMADYSSQVFHGSKSSLGNSRQSLIPKTPDGREGIRLPSPQPKVIKSKSSRTASVDQKFELVPKAPSVFVSRSSGELRIPQLNLRPEAGEGTSGHAKQKRTSKRPPEGAGISLNATKPMHMGTSTTLA
ncbi:palmitoyltransferase ZDHHC1 isoform X2 [Latimeria chalumnae]|uniref:palmitoyltransferase ZDHHC1 isoform X2 n=1 Tax=Latimeria chalumnae TaxID=7897 RepID=UPI00313EB922